MKSYPPTAQCLLSFSFWKFITQHHLQFVLYPFSMFAVNFHNRCREHLHIRRKGGASQQHWGKTSWSALWPCVTSSYIYKKSESETFSKDVFFCFFVFFYWENYKKMYSTKLTVSHSICSELTPPPKEKNTTLGCLFVRLFFSPFFFLCVTFKKLYFW